MLEKFGVHVSWLNSGGGKVIAKGKVDNSNSMRMEKRNSEQQQGGSNDDQLPIVLPQLQLDMALVLVLVQDNNVALNSAAGPSKNRLAPPTPNSKSNLGLEHLYTKSVTQMFCIRLCYKRRI